MRTQMFRWKGFPAPRFLKSPSITWWLCPLLLAFFASSVSAETVRRGLGPEPDSLHIHKAQGLSAVNLLRDLREGLVTFNSAGEPVPGQADRWEILDEGRRYRFRIRGDARWSNGDPVTSADFVRAWHRAFDPSSAAATAGLLKDVLNARHILAGKAPIEDLGITAVDDQTLDILLKEPAPWILEILAHPVSYPLHETGAEDPVSAPVNGAFVLGEWVPRASLKLLRNDQYYAANLVQAEQVEYFPIDDPSSELSRYRAGELDITETIPPGRYEWLTENLPADLRVSPYLGSFWLGFNLRHPLLGQSSDLRKALSLAINREILVNTVLGAGELPGWSVVPPGMEGYEPAMMTGHAASQEERERHARQLFAKIGLGADEPLVLELRYNTSTIHRRVAVAVAAMWKQVLGVSARLVNEEWKVFVNNRSMGTNTEVFRGGWIADYADPSSFLDLFIGGSSLNHTFYENPEYDQLLTAASRTTGEARLELLRQAEALLMQDMPVIPLYYYVSRHLVRPGITGYVDNVRDVHLSRYLGRE